MARKAVKLWHVYFAPRCNHVRPYPKDKYVVIVHIDKNPMGFLINSRISDWLRKRPYLLTCEASILAEQHPFLRYDSFVDCRDIYEFFDWELDKMLGPVSQQAKSDILRAIQTCPVIERKYKHAILNREGLPSAPEEDSPNKQQVFLRPNTTNPSN